MPQKWSRIADSKSVGIGDFPVEVLGIILDKLELGEQLKSRLVCKAWNGEVCKLLENNFTFHTTCYTPETEDPLSSSPSTIVTDFVTLANLAESLNLPTLLRRISLSFNIEGRETEYGTFFRLCSRLHGSVKEIQMSFDSSSHREILSQTCSEIIEKCGDSLEILDISGSTSTFFLEIFSQLPRRSFPELKFLGFPLLNLPDYEAGKSVRSADILVQVMSTLSAILDASPKLCGFHAGESSYPFIPPCATLDLSRIEHVVGGAFVKLGLSPRRRSALELIDNFTPGTACDRWLISELRKLDPPAQLKSFIFEQTSFLDVYNVIHSATTLEFLTLESNHLGVETDAFPVLPRLEYLAVNRCVTTQIHVSVPSSRKCPVLKELETGILMLDQLPPLEDLPVCLRLENLGVSNLELGPTEESQQQSFLALRRMFPNLKSLKIHLDAWDVERLLKSESHELLPESQQLILEELICYPVTAGEEFPRFLWNGLKRLYFLDKDTNGAKRCVNMLRSKPQPLLPDLQKVGLKPYNTKPWHRLFGTTYIYTGLPDHSDGQYYYY